MDEELLKGIVARGAFSILWGALADHKDFWAGWIQMRTDPMADFFAPTNDEREAAKALGDALIEVGKSLKELEPVLAGEKED